MRLLTATQVDGPGEFFQCIEGELVIPAPCNHGAGADLACCRAFFALSCETGITDAVTSTGMIRERDLTMSGYIDAIAATLMRIGSDPANAAVTAPQIAGGMRFHFRGPTGTIFRRSWNQILGSPGELTPLEAVSDAAPADLRVATLRPARWTRNGPPGTGLQGPTSRNGPLRSRR